MAPRPPDEPAATLRRALADAVPVPGTALDDVARAIEMGVRLFAVECRTVGLRPEEMLLILRDVLERWEVANHAPRRTELFERASQWAMESYYI